MTYLEVVNKVLRKLREDVVSTVTYDSYSTLIGEFVNDAKREVENAFNWSVHRKVTVFQTNGSNVYPIASDSSVSLLGGFLTNEFSRLAYDECSRPMAFDITAGQEIQLAEWPFEYYTRQAYLATFNTTNTVPRAFAQSGEEGTGVTIYFNGYPNNRTYSFVFYTPQAELTSNATVIEVPWAPIYHLAVLYALDERGEEIGEPGSKAWLRYERSLADSIALDNTRNPNKTQFTVP